MLGLKFGKSHKINIKSALVKRGVFLGMSATVTIISIDLISRQDRDYKWHDSSECRVRFIRLASDSFARRRLQLSDKSIDLDVGLTTQQTRHVKPMPI